MIWKFFSKSTEIFIEQLFLLTRIISILFKTNMNKIIYLNHINNSYLNFLVIELRFFTL